MKEKEKEGYWYITIGYVFNQEPRESGPKCTVQEFHVYKLFRLQGGGRGQGERGDSVLKSTLHTLFQTPRRITAGT
jgi:hypothetical protein